MSNYTDEEELEFVESLYNEADKQIKEVYKEQKNNRDELLKQIATIMITYTILDSLMSLSKADKKKEYNKLSKMVTKGAQGQGSTQNKVIKEILTITVNKTFDFYNYNVGLKDVREIIGNNFKGKHFSSRVWSNEENVAKHLHKQVNDFLNGKVNVNQIKRNIEKTYNTSAYNAHRLVETEVARVENESFKRFCRETDVKKVRRVATLDSRTCSDCSGHDSEMYDFKNAPDLPAHPLCRCYLTIEEDDKRQLMIMNLQLFGIDEKKEFQKIIDNGIIDEIEYNKCYKYFDKHFKNGVKTPIETVYNKKDRFVHIARRHPDMISNKEVDNIIGTLKSPDIILKTKDRFSNEAIGYIKKIENKELLTIVNNGIITSYYPSKNYLDKIKRGEVTWLKK